MYLILAYHLFMNNSFFLQVSIHAALLLLAFAEMQSAIFCVHHRLEADSDFDWRYSTI